LNVPRAIRAAVAATAALSLCIAAVRGDVARAGAGDLVADVLVPEAEVVWPRGLAPSVGFDGQSLYYLDYAGSVLHRIAAPPPGASIGTGHLDVPIMGAPSGVMTIAYDRGRDLFWAVSGDGLTIYQLTKSGNATLAFRIDPATDRPGLQAGPAATEVKIAYDGTDDTLWYSPDATTRIYHYRTTPDMFGTATLVTANPYIEVDTTAQCGYSQSSGVASGGASLFVSVAGCPYYFEFTKSGSLVGAYAYTWLGAQSTQDIECDDVTYGAPVFWIKDGYDGHIRAFEQPRPGACGRGGG
jgi:hypothetical protein